MKNLLIKPLILVIFSIIFLSVKSEIYASPPAHQQTITATGVSVSQITSGTIAGGTNQLYIVSVVNRSNDNATVSGLGLSNWTLRKRQCSGRGNLGLEIWSGFGSPSAGTISINFPGNVISAVVAVSRYSNADPANPVQTFNGSSTLGQNNSLCTGGVDNINANLSMSTGNAESIIYAATGSRTPTISTADINYFERSTDVAGTSGNTSRLYIHDRILSASGSDIISHSLSSAVDWVMAGLEIRPAPVATATPTKTPTPTPTLTPAATLTPTLTPIPTAIPIGPDLDQVNSIYSYSGLGHYTLSPSFNGNRTNNKDMTIFLISGSLEIPANFSMTDPNDSVIFIVNGNIFVNGNVTRIPGVYISSQTFTVAPSDNPIVIEGMVYANKINLGRTYYSLAQPTYQIIYQPKYIIDLLPYLGRPQVNWQEVIQ